MTVMVIAFFVTAIVAVNETDFRQAKGKEKQKSKGG